MNKKEKYNIAKWAIENALKSGAQHASVFIYENKSSSIAVREEKIEKLKQANRNSLSISLYVDNKYSSHTTNRLNNKEELARFIKEAVTGTKFLAEDEFRKLPDPDLYYKGGGVDLETFDKSFNSVDPQEKIKHAFNIEKEVLGTDDRIISVSTDYYDSLSEVIMVSSNGFEGDRNNTYYRLAASVSVKSGDARPQSSWSESSIFYNQLNRDNIGKQALERALKKLGQRKIDSGKMPMIVENRSIAYGSSPLLGPMISALNGRSIQQKNSYLIDQLSKQIAAKGLNIVDDPFIKSGRGSVLFDGEGLATKKREVITNGILKNYFIDTYYGRKLDMKPTSGSTTNLMIEPGKKSLEELILSLDKGILVTGFNGGNSNGSTGDYSYGVEGFLIEKGIPVQPISEMNITGNLKDLWMNFLEAGSDTKENSSWRIPSLLFDGVDFSGS